MGKINISQNAISLIRHLSENCALLGYYAARSDNSLPTFWDNLSVLIEQLHVLTQIRPSPGSV